MSNKLSQKERKKIIEEIMDEIRVNMHSYHDFILDCVEAVVNKWGDGDLKRWTGEDC